MNTIYADIYESLNESSLKEQPYNIYKRLLTDEMVIKTFDGQKLVIWADSEKQARYKFLKNNPQYRDFLYNILDFQIYAKIDKEKLAVIQSDEENRSTKTYWWNKED